MAEKICGIYSIECTMNHKKYIGQSTHIKRRWNEHKKELKNNSHYNFLLQEDWNRFRETDFTFSIIELCGKEQLDDREVFWIAELNTQIDGYNISKGGNDYSKKLEKSRTEKSYSENKYDKRKKLQEDQVLEIIQRLLNGETGALLAKEYHVSSMTINDIRNHKKWKQLTKGINFPNIFRKAIDMYSEEGKLLKTFSSAREAAKELGIRHTSISSVCVGRIRSTGGYIWRFHKHPFDEFYTDKKHISEKVQINQYDSEWNYIQSFNSIAEAERFIGKKFGISNALKNINNTSGGYHWLKSGEQPPVNKNE